MSKIYSRTRFLLKPRINKRKTFIMTIVLIIIGVIIIILRHMNPLFETLCEERVKSISTLITNQQSSIVMNKYQYEELYTIEKDENGDIVIIKSNVIPINNLISDLTENIQNEFNKIEKTKINIPIGSIFGNYFLSGTGPNIPVKVITTGTLDTELKSEFIAKGINQTLHRVYVNFECNVKIITPLKNYEKRIANQVLIIEHVIVGNIPETYYNLEGMSSPEDTLNVIN